MSFLDSLTKKSRLDSYIKQTAKARKSEGVQADQMFKTVYQGYAEVVSGDPIRAEALYYWGHALLHQAKTKSGEEAVNLYQDARTKFAFCMTIDPNYLAAAIDGGVACMDLARLNDAKSDDPLYDMARREFEKANAIQAGAASYNLACIYALRGETDPCLEALETAKSKGSLPDADDIVNDPDMSGVKNKKWFQQFLQVLNEAPEAEESTADSDASSSGAKPKSETTDQATE